MHMCIAVLCAPCCVRWGGNHCVFRGIHLLTCWPWCYKVQPCHGTTSVTHHSLSSLAKRPTLLFLTHWHKFCLTELVCRPSVCSGISHLYSSLSPTCSCRLLSWICSHAPLVLSLSVSHSSVAFPRPTLVGLGGQQAMTVVLAVDFEVTFAQLHWDWVTVAEPQRQRGKKLEQVVHGKYWMTERQNVCVCLYVCVISKDQIKYKIVFEVKWGEHILFKCTEFAKEKQSFWHQAWIIFMTQSVNSTYICLCLFAVVVLAQIRQVWDLVPVHVGVKSNVESPTISWLTFNHHGNKWAASDCSPESF